MKKTLPILFVLFAALSLSSCSVFPNGDENKSSVNGSGHIAAQTVSVSPELGGRVAKVMVAEGDTIQEDDILFALDDELYQIQFDQAQAAIMVAEAAVEVQKAQLEAALVNYDIAVQGARIQDQPGRNTSWVLSQPDEFDLPAWYFEKNENYAAAEEELLASEANLGAALVSLEYELSDTSNTDLIAAESRLAEARTAYTIAQIVLSEAQTAQENERLEDVAQEGVDAALSELEATQLEYDRILSESAYDDLLDARAHVAIARNRYDITMDFVDQFRTGEESLQVKAAYAVVQKAEAGVFQAESALEQAKTAKQSIEVQMEKTTIYAPVSGVVLALNLNVGEVVSAGSSSLVIGELDEVELTVYIPEDRYGQVMLGQTALITVDSFPGETFEGIVVQISDEAEFTPRNVQTVDGRKSTVYAVVINIPNADWKLKSGMPADAIIDIGQ